MTSPPKLSQLQIRVTEAEKAAIRNAAERAGMDMSAYVLRCVLANPADEFQKATGALAGSAQPSYALADINSLLANLSASGLRDAVAAAPQRPLSPFLGNYVAAMVEIACERRSIPVPGWTHGIEPLDSPSFGSSLQSLRLHLLICSPASFRRRNIFIDATIGDRV